MSRGTAGVVFGSVVPSRAALGISCNVSRRPCLGFQEAQQ